MKYIDDYIDDLFLNEAKTTSQRRVTRGEKISRAIGSLAVQRAKKQNDSLYQLYKKHKDKYKDYKAKIIKKYGARVRSQARR